MKVDPSRVSSAGYWRYAWDYLCAAENVEAGPNKNLMFPALHLCGQSIELFLKAFLLQRGESPSQIERYRHRLTELLKEARRRKLGRTAKLSAKDLAVISVLAASYSGQPYPLRYFARGIVEVPPVATTLKTAGRLAVGLEHLCTGSNRTTARRANNSLKSDAAKPRTLG